MQHSQSVGTLRQSEPERSTFEAVDKHTLAVKEVSVSEVESVEVREDFFNHLTHLSILHRETQHMQQTDGEGPEDYRVEF